MTLEWPIIAVHGVNVSLTVIFPIESLSAVLALKRFLLGVNTAMVSPVTFVIKSFVADIAPMVHNLNVYPLDMLFEHALRGITFIASIAMIRSAITIGSDLLLQSVIVIDLKLVLIVSVQLNVIRN